MKAKTSTPTIPTLIREYIDRGVNAQQHYADHLFKDAKERIGALAKKVEGADDQIYHLTQRMESAEEAGTRIDLEMEALREKLNTTPGPSNVKIESAVLTAGATLNESAPIAESAWAAVAIKPSLNDRCSEMLRQMIDPLHAFYKDTGLIVDSLKVQRHKNGWTLVPLFTLPGKENSI